MLSRSSMRSRLCIPIALILSGCTAAKDSGSVGGTDTALPDTVEGCTDVPQVTWDGWAEGFFSTYCDACHSATSPERSGAPADLTFDTLPEVQARAALVRSSVLEQRTMPLGGGVSAEQEVLLDVFLRCTLGAR